jgi:hypothetical protein
MLDLLPQLQMLIGLVAGVCNAPNLRGHSSEVIWLVPDEMPIALGDVVRLPIPGLRHQVMPAVRMLMRGE